MSPDSPAVVDCVLSRVINIELRLGLAGFLVPSTGLLISPSGAGPVTTCCPLTGPVAIDTSGRGKRNAMFSVWIAGSLYGSN